MRIAISATGPEVSSLAEERFGRCAYFLIFDEQKKLQEVINNKGAATAEGAGIKTTQVLLRHNVDVVLTGRVGPKAMQALLKGGVSVYTGLAGTAEDTLKRYLNGAMEPLGVPNAQQHAGMGKSERAVK